MGVNGDLINKFSAQEIQNELLAAIHNRLAEISKFLEIGIAHFARLDAHDTAYIKGLGTKKFTVSYHTYGEAHVGYDCYISSDKPVGFETDKDLYYAEEEDGFEDERYRHVPLGESDTRTRPTNDDGKFLLDKEIKERGETVTEGKNMTDSGFVSLASGIRKRLREYFRTCEKTYW